LDTVRNTITANVVPLNSTRNVVVFATTDTFVLPANKKTQLTFEFSNPTTNLWMVQPGSSTKGPYTPVYWDNVYPWPDPNQSGFGIPHGMACARSAQTGGTVRGMPFPTVVYMDAKTITLEFTNPYSSVTYITNDGQNANSLITYTMFGGGTTYDKVMQYWGSPSIMLVGDMLTAGSPQPITYVEPYSVSQYGTQVLPLTDSQWRQDTTTALGLVGQVAADLSVPFPVATVTAIGDPRLQLDDRVKLQAGDYDGISTLGDDMTYTAPTFTAGQPALASDIQNLANAVQRVDQTVSVPIVASLIQTGSPTLTANSLLALPLNVVDVDTTGGSMTSTANRITITQPGRYIVSAGMGFQGQATANFIACQVQKNGSSSSQLCANNGMSIPNASFQSQLSCDRVVTLVAGDYLELMYFSSVARTTGTGSGVVPPYLSVVRVSL
jgi:hypothetical protein